MDKSNLNMNVSKSIDAQYNKAMAFLGKLFECVEDVDAILQEVARHYDADRAYIFEFSSDKKTINNTYEWCKEGVKPEKDNLQNLPFESVATWVSEFERVGAFFISSLDKDVESNSLTYEILEPQGIESLITAPIYKNNKIIGFIGVDNPHINTDDLVILKTTASILYSEIKRKITKKNKAIETMTMAQQKQDAELGEIRDIISSANMGTWRIELVDNEEPRMFVDDTMRRLLGAEDLDHSPEETYNDWFSNITEEAVPSVLSSVDRMKHGYFDENTYLWNHPQKGVRYVRCGGTAKLIPGGFSLQGYHYDVDEVVRKEQDHTLELKNALEERKTYYDTLGALGDIFYSMHVLDLTNDTIEEFSAKNEVKDIVNCKNGASTKMIEVMTSVVTDEFLEEALKFTDLSTIESRLHNKLTISRELVGRHVGWFLASFITMESDEEGNPTKVIFTTRVIDEEKKEQQELIYKTQTDEMTGLLNRRAYEEKIYENNDVPTEDKFVYVSLDVNGLKVTNDTIGHTAGDELLIGVSSCMKKSLGSHGELFRIGGDEFVAILFCDENEIKKVLEDFDNEVANWRGKIVESISVSYGWVNKNEMPNASTRELGAVAEKRMYDVKSAYYRKMGVDRRGMQDAHKILCDLYTKILRINLTEDSYQIINMKEAENADPIGKKISEWLISFGKLGYVHPDDLDEYLRLTDLNYMKKYFNGGKTSLHVFYRRKIGDVFKKVMMEIVPANDYSEDNLSLFLYVKDIDV